MSVRRQDGEGATPLHYAARRGNLKAAELLIAFGADVLAFDSDQSTPAALALDAGRGDVVQFLEGVTDRLTKLRGKTWEEGAGGGDTEEASPDSDAAGARAVSTASATSTAKAAPVIETPEAARLRRIRESIERIVGAAREHGGLLNVPIPRSDTLPQPLPPPGGGDDAEDSSAREGAADAPPQVDASYWDEWDGGGSSSDESEDGLLDEAPPLTPGPKEGGRKTDLKSLLEGLPWEVRAQGHGGAS